jgi:5-methylcytosine-specific restriction endonuclease McrA
MNFDYPEDKKFFRRLLCKGGKRLSAYSRLFDLRPARIKRAEFNCQMPRLKKELLKRYGRVCQLQIVEDCNVKAGLTIDHLIPLSSNKLNKELRKLRPLPGCKVASQSFGSNDLSNLVLACGRCNGHKKHKFLEREQLQRVLSRKKAT